MEDALYQWDANASAFVPFTGDASPPETFDAFTIRAIGEQGMEAGYGAQVVAAARRFDGAAPATGEVDQPPITIPVGELSVLRGRIRDVLAVTLGDERSPLARDVLVAVGELHAADARILGIRHVPLPPVAEVTS